jgi:hypothetical protein
MTWHRIDDPENPPPKDGSWILVFEPSDYAAYPKVHVVRWGVPEWSDGDHTWVTIALGPNPDNFCADGATHWTPLPPPPGDG